VVPPLRGAHGYKEAGAYVLQGCSRRPRQIGNRVHRFPFLEPDEPFATGDGTVHYMMTCPAIPGEIVRDNPAVRVIFALRDPVSRMWSDYRFAAEWYRQKKWGFNDVVDGTLPNYQNCLDQFVNGSYARGLLEAEAKAGGGPRRKTRPHQQAQYFVPAPKWLGEARGSRAEERALDAGALSFYTSRCPTSLGDNHNLVKKSVYVFQVRHWLSVLGKERVRVVTTEEIAKDQKKVLVEVLDFMGLCPFTFGNLGRDNVTPFDVRGSFRINEESFKKLKRFFKPYNQLLYEMIGRDLSWEKKTFDSFKK